MNEPDPGIAELAASARPTQEVEGRTAVGVLDLGRRSPSAPPDDHEEGFTVQRRVLVKLVVASWRNIGGS
jgi:hypothetical protein